MIRDSDVALHIGDRFARNLNGLRILVEWMRTKVAPLELFKEHLFNKQKPRPELE